MGVSVRCQFALDENNSSWDGVINLSGIAVVAWHAYSWEFLATLF